MPTLNATMDAVGEILGTITRGEVDIGPRNWLSTMWCYQARRWTDNDGEEGVTVYIDHSSPDAHHLQKHVADELEKRGFGKVEVVTEW